MYKFIFALFCFWQVPVQADKYIVASQDFNYYPHYNFQSETDKGLIWAVLQEFSKFSGHQFTYRPMPVLRLQRELDKGTIDLVYPDNPLFNNEQTYAKGKYYSDTIVHTLGGTMVKPSTVSKNIDTIKSLGIPFGFTPQLGWKNLIDSKQISLTFAITPLAVLQLLAIDRVDAVEVDYFVSRYQIQNIPKFKQFKFNLELPHSIVEFKLSTIKQPRLIDEINDFIRSQPKVIKRLKLQYGILPPETILHKLKQPRL